MAGLKYREDMDAVRERLTTWWHGGDLGRPMMKVHSLRKTPIEDIPEMPKPKGWLTDYSTSDFDYRVNLSARDCISLHYLGEAVPFTAPDLGPNCLALYLGCRGVDQVDTVWFEPCMESREDARFIYDRDNFYWDFTLRLAHEQLRLGKGKFLIQFPDLIEGLDTLAAMRGTQQLLMDMIEDPDWVHACLRQITDRYFHYYDILYDLFRDEVGGSHYWVWAPGRVSKLQCDFSAMIGPDMFDEFMMPVLREMCERLSYSLYHMDGPGALCHLDHLLSIESLDMIQWVPGSGAEPTDHPTWWPYYHRMLDAAKKVYIGVSSIENLQCMRKEFGQGLNQFLIRAYGETVEEAQRYIEVAQN